MLGNFLKIDYIVVCFLKPLNSTRFLLGNDGQSSKQVGSQASRTWRLAWIQPVCTSINVVPALKGLMPRSVVIVDLLTLDFAQNDNVIFQGQISKFVTQNDYWTLLDTFLIVQ